VLLIRNKASQVALMLLRSSGKILYGLPSFHLCTFALLLRSWPNLNLTFLRAVPSHPVIFLQTPLKQFDFRNGLATTTDLNSGLLSNPQLLQDLDSTQSTIVFPALRPNPWCIHGPSSLLNNRMPPREANRRSSIEHDRDPTWWSSSTWIMREERNSRTEVLFGGLAVCDTTPYLIMDEFAIVGFDENIDKIPTKQSGSVTTRSSIRAVS
jgi:hypothetical protein